MNKAKAKKLLKRIDGAMVMVTGDPIIDLYYYGAVVKLSPEAPVPVFVSDEQHWDERKGGAANVAANLAAWGCHVATHFPEWPWCLKTRYIAGHHQLIRIDRDQDYSKLRSDRGDVLGHMQRAGALVISDYGKGWCGRELCENMIMIAHDEVPGRSVPVIVDPKGGDWSKYTGADIICPNEHELAAYEAHPGQTAVFRTMVQKRGARGLRVVKINEHKVRAEHAIPSLAKSVFDVTGAGDTVVAMIAAGTAAGIDLSDAAELANIAAGVVVGKLGTSIATPDEIIEACQ